MHIWATVQTSLNDNNNNNNNNSDKTVEAVREFEEHAMASGHQSLVKDAVKYAEKLNITLQLDTLNPVWDCIKSWESVETISREAVLGDR